MQREPAVLKRSVVSTRNLGQPEKQQRSEDVEFLFNPPSQDMELKQNQFRGAET